MIREDEQVVLAPQIVLANAVNLPDLAVDAPQPARLSLNLAPSSPLHLDGRAVTATPSESGLAELDLPAGRHTLEGARPTDAALGAMRDALASFLEQGEQRRAAERNGRERRKASGLPALEAVFSANVEGRITAFTPAKVSHRSVYAILKGAVRLSEPACGIMRPLRVVSQGTKP